MERNILVTGANGQLGCAIQTLASKRDDCTFHFTDVDTLDICDAAQVADYLRTYRIQYVLNCAAYTAVDRAEDDEATCMRINRDAVQTIGEVAQRQAVKVIHVSTDYVFDGRATRPYRETDATHPLSTYGRSKHAGEVALLQACPEAVIIRTAWLYAECGSNFVKTILRLGNERDELSVVSDQTGTPTYARDLAAAMLTVATHSDFVPGIYHYSDGGKICSWYDFAVKILTLAGLKCRVRPVATCDYPTRAVRPAYSALDKEKIKRIYCVDVPDWETSLQQCIRQLNSTH